MVAAKAYSACLMDRVSRVGEGAKVGREEKGLGQEGEGEDGG